MACITDVYMYYVIALDITCVMEQSPLSPLKLTQRSFRLIRVRANVPAWRVMTRRGASPLYQKKIVVNA